MSQENVEILLRWWDALNRQDWEAANALCHPEIEIQDHPGVDAGGWNYGREGAWLWRTKLTEAFSDFQLHAETVFPLDKNSVLAHGSGSGKGAHSDIPVRIIFAAVVTFEDGLGRRVAVYETLADALRGAADVLEAVGLSE